MYNILFFFSHPRNVIIIYQYASSAIVEGKKKNEQKRFHVGLPIIFQNDLSYQLG